uniref:NADH dehydrogenase subunit 3 n=1 Tax=Rosacea flaccida TaxID=316189 RepID=UPI0026E3FAD6|nr:NADH dehydrogenase subunit 3 [Rosacea flaccida]WJJ70111.1 NADH dehydrogenase subunit 3 [Rosacea flaccida]
MLCILLLLSLFLSTIISTLSYFLTWKNPNKEKLTTYECGFNPIYYPGKPFSIKFFVIALVFLIFDLEISLLFPWSSYTSKITIDTQYIIIFFIFFLIIGLIYEWKLKSLEWN